MIRKPPFGNLDSWEGLRLSLSFYAADTHVDILLEGFGVMNWTKGIAQDSKNPDSVSRSVSDIARFNIPVYIIAEDLHLLGLTEDDLTSLHPKIITRESAMLLLAAYETTIAV